MKNIYPVTQNSLPKAVDLLKKNNLPTEDINENTLLFVMQDEYKEVVGTVGLEMYGEDALLRSLCVSEDKRACGEGIRMVEFVEALAITKGIKKLYLLTTTASNFFLKRRYKIIDRAEVSQTIQQTSEFSSVCPSSAIVMIKELA